MSLDDDVARMDARTLAAHIRTRALSAMEVTETALARLARLDPLLHAFCTPTPELARATARAVDAQLAAGEPVGPLAGVPVGIKDLVFTANIRTTFGSPLYRDFVPEEDDIVVERLKAAGAVILGKTNATEFGYSGVGHNPVFPTTRNPWDTALTPGGSSAGSGAAVAAGIVPFAIGSDGGGSVRIPAAHCGIYGFKPSMGRVPVYPGCRDERYPGASSWESLEHIGPMSRSVGDAALMLNAIVGPDPRDRYSIPASDGDYLAAIAEPDITGLRVAFSEDWGYAAVDPEVRRVAAAAAEVFATVLGCRLERADPGWEDPAAMFATLIAAETDLGGMRRMINGREHEISPHLLDLLRRDWTAEEITDAKTGRKRLCNTMWRFMAHYDLLLTPTLAVPPFPVHMQGPEVIDGRMVRSNAWLCFTFPANLTGQPAASVPAGLTAAGLPVGLQIMGRHLDDRTVLRASAAFEHARPWLERLPWHGSGSAGRVRNTEY
ncbi:amidase [Acidiphilium sp.]|uniref:amidase n=1 Tax=Acidiphilium sp. TaxID=527 RepID=UPI0025866F3C|nr:amidase [Acidiphilium sp.]